MHLSHYLIPLVLVATTQSGKKLRFKDIGLDLEVMPWGTKLDDVFFFSVPSSFFVLDTRVPRILRELMAEAEGSLKSNFLTGASACARKMIYELARLFQTQGANYEERIKALKKIHEELDPTYFDTLLTIQQVTSEKVHEDSYDGWEAKHLRLILSTLSEVLREIYVMPKVREEKRKAILGMRDEILNPNPTQPVPTGEAAAGTEVSQAE